MNNELTTIEESELLALEATIEGTQNAFVACGMALDRIRDKKLYRRDFSSFEDYCQSKWGWSRQRAHQLIEAANTVMKLPEDKQKEVKTEYQAAKIKKESLNQKCQVNFGSSLDSSKVEKIINLDKTGFPIPATLIEDWNRATDVGRDCLRRASELKCMIDDGKKNDVIWVEVTQSAIAYAQNLHSFLKSLVPHAVCTSCQGRNPAKCATCKGRGFISEHYYDNAIPIEIKEIRKKSLSK